MNDIVSKKLFCEVLGLPIEEGVEFILKEDVLLLKKGECCVYGMNIYEFAFKVKGWALKQGWYLNTCITNEGAYCDGDKPPTSQEFHIEADTEPEAIFKAGEWVLKQLKGENMKIFKVAYNPPFSARLINTLKVDYEPSMVDLEGQDGQYDIDLAEDAIENGNGDKKDWEVLEKLKKEGVDYIEI